MSFILSSRVESPSFPPCGTWLSLTEHIPGDFVVTRVIEDVESYKYGPDIRSKWYTSRRRALIAYGIAKLRDTLAWGLS